MAYLVSLLVGIAVGVAYALIGVRSPAPPLVALVGPLGIVAGEQGVPWARARIAERHAAAVSSPAPRPHGGPRQGSPGEPHP